MKNLIFLIAFALTVSVMAQSSNENQYTAYLKASKTMWERSIKEANQEKGEDSFEVALAMYGLLGSTMAKQDEETFDQYEEQTIYLLENLIEENPDWGEPKAVLSSTYGLVMAYSPMKGMILGMKSNSLMEDAIKLQPESPLVQKLYAGSKLYTPKMFGGDAEEAVMAFSKSIAIYREQGDTKDNWLYLDAMMGLAMAYKSLEKYDEAKATLEEAIAVEPQYYWAKATLEKINKS